MTIEFTRAEIGMLINGLRAAMDDSRRMVFGGRASARHQVLIDKLTLAHAQAEEHDECDGTMEG